MKIYKTYNDLVFVVNNPARMKQAVIHFDNGYSMLVMWFLDGDSEIKDKKMSDFISICGSEKEVTKKMVEIQRIKGKNKMNAQDVVSNYTKTINEFVEFTTTQLIKLWERVSILIKTVQQTADEVERLSKELDKLKGNKK